MCRILRLAIRCSTERTTTGDVLRAVAAAAGVDLLDHTRVPPHTIVVVGVDDDRPDELLAIDFAVALRVVAGEHPLHAGAVRLVDTGTRP